METILGLPFKGNTLPAALGCPAGCRSSPSLSMWKYALAYRCRMISSFEPSSEPCHPEQYSMRKCASIPVEDLRIADTLVQLQAFSLPPSHASGMRESLDTPSDRSLAKGSFDSQLVRSEPITPLRMTILMTMPDES